MREIKFRGLRTDGKGWVYGYVDYNKYNNICVIHSDLDTTQVIPISVGQFTGLKDKNGKDIYEGDVLENEFKEREEVEYTIQQRNEWYGHGLSGYSITSGFYIHPHFGCKFEIIGNIHEQK